MQGKEITLNLAKEALKHYQKSDMHEIDSSVIIDSVSRYFNLSVDDTRPKKEKCSNSHSETNFNVLCRNLTNMSYPDIRKAFNGKVPYNGDVRLANKSPSRWKSILSSKILWTS